MAEPSTRDEEKRKLLLRLKRIEGQIRGIQRMIEEEKDCVDILIQVAAAKAALNKAGLALLEGHSRECLVEAIRMRESDEAVDELMNALLRFIR